MRFAEIVHLRADGRAAPRDVSNARGAQPEDVLRRSSRQQNTVCAIIFVPARTVAAVFLRLPAFHVDGKSTAPDANQLSSLPPLVVATGRTRKTGSQKCSRAIRRGTASTRVTEQEPDLEPEPAMVMETETEMESEWGNIAFCTEKRVLQKITNRNLHRKTKNRNRYETVPAPCTEKRLCAYAQKNGHGCL